MKYYKIEYNLIIVAENDITVINCNNDSNISCEIAENLNMRYNSRSKIIPKYNHKALERVLNYLAGDNAKIINII